MQEEQRPSGALTTIYIRNHEQRCIECTFNMINNAAT